jgi:hypothetical protein
MVFFLLPYDDHFYLYKRLQNENSGNIPSEFESYMMILFMLIWCIRVLFPRLEPLTHLKPS